jgi:hypothetical protein
VIEISDREVIVERVPPSDLPIPGPLVEERVGPLAVPLLLALRRVLMYLLVYLARVEVRDCDRAVLGDTHEVAPSLLPADSPRTAIGHEQPSDRARVMRVDQDYRRDAVLVERVVVPARV